MTIGENGVTEKDILVHNPKREDPTIAFMLANLSSLARLPHAHRRLPRRDEADLRRAQLAADRGCQGEARRRQHEEAALRQRHLGGQLGTRAAPSPRRAKLAGAPLLLAGPFARRGGLRRSTPRHPARSLRSRVHLHISAPRRLSTQRSDPGAASRHRRQARAPSAHRPRRTSAMHHPCSASG